MRRAAHILFCSCLISGFLGIATAEEFILGEENIHPGISFVFEAAPEDAIAPAGYHLPKSQTDIHLEVLASWLPGKQGLGKAFSGSFVPYLKISALVVNEKTRRSIQVDLVPHLNLTDAIHYARNIALPGRPSDLYTVHFQILPPALGQLSFHHDWVQANGARLFSERSFIFKGINFEKAVKASRP